MRHAADKKAWLHHDHSLASSSDQSLIVSHRFALVPKAFSCLSNAKHQGVMLTTS